MDYELVGREEELDSLQAFLQRRTPTRLRS